MNAHTAEKDVPAPVPESDVWPVHRALGDWMWKDADAPRLSRDAQWRIAEWIVRERESVASATHDSGYQWGVTQGDEPVRTLHEEGARFVARRQPEGHPRRRLMRRTLGPWVEMPQDDGAP